MQVIWEILVAAAFIMFKLVFAVTIMGAIFLAWAVGFEPATLEVTSTEIKVPGWQTYWTSVRVVVLSDLHVGAPHMTLRQVRKIVDATNIQDPDIVLLLGDYMSGDYFRSVPPRAITDVLGKLSAKHGVYAVLGEHDWRTGDTSMSDALKGANITVLNNQAASINFAKNRRIWIVGLADSASGQRPNYARAAKPVRRGDAVIVMMHNPNAISQVPATAAASFAGHTHGGQLNIPFVPQISLVPADTAKRYARGLISVESKPLFVSSGLGASAYPIRMNLPPEIAIVTLRPGG